MRRNNRKHVKKDVDNKITMYVGIGIVAVIIFIVGIYIYNKNIEEDIKQAKLNMNKITENISDNETESASYTIGKSINEVQDENNTNNIANGNVSENVVSNNTNNLENDTKNIVNENVSVEIENDEKKIELNFEKPVEGEIIKEYAKEQLIYSNTLKEWITHNGIDIKAEKTTVVKAAEAGTVESIKNDPRYGLTVIVSHENGFKTLYANLLTSEFVVEGEKIEKGQTIGTVGDTATFEITDEPHLHFEILKDLQQVDPTIYVQY